MRELLGWSQAKLAETAGLDQPKISQIESGALWPASDIQAISAATGFPIGWLERPSPDELPAGSIRYRKRSKASKTDDRMAVRRLEVAAEIAADLAATVRTPPIALHFIGAPESDADIEAAATETRDAMELARRGPIKNLIRRAERAGAIAVGLPSDFSVAGRVPHHHGISAWPDLKRPPVIGFSTLDPGDRQRHTIGHEIGHLVLHRGVEDQSRDYEAEASCFAGALLMPLDDAREAFDQHFVMRTLVKLKQTWGISIAALIMRAKQVGAIDADRVESLFKQLSARGWRTVEPVTVRREDPRVLLELLSVASSTRGSNNVDWRRLGRSHDLPPFILRELACATLDPPTPAVDLEPATSHGNDEPNSAKQRNLDRHLRVVPARANRRSDR